MSKQKQNSGSCMYLSNTSVHELMMIKMNTCVMYAKTHARMLNFKLIEAVLYVTHLSKFTLQTYL